MATKRTILEHLTADELRGVVDQFDLEVEDRRSRGGMVDVNDSAVAVLGDKILIQIARELTQTLRNSVTIDWTFKETVRAKLRTLVRRKLRQHGYPLDKAEKAVETVLKQAELLAAEWAA